MKKRKASVASCCAKAVALARPGRGRPGRGKEGNDTAKWRASRAQPKIRARLAGKLGSTIGSTSATPGLALSMANLKVRRKSKNGRKVLFCKIWDAAREEVYIGVVATHESRVSIP